MKGRRSLAWLAVAALAACGVTGCSGDGDSTLVDLKAAAQCDKLAAACGDVDTHIETIGQECRALAESSSACTDAALALYDCYERELCGGDDEVWALDDLRVLSERHEVCLEQRDALERCVESSASRD